MVSFCFHDIPRPASDETDQQDQPTLPQEPFHEEFNLVSTEVSSSSSINSNVELPSYPPPSPFNEHYDISNASFKEMMDLHCEKCH